MIQLLVDVGTMYFLRIKKLLWERNIFLIRNLPIKLCVENNEVELIVSQYNNKDWLASPSYLFAHTTINKARAENCEADTATKIDLRHWVITLNTQQ